MQDKRPPAVSVIITNYNYAHYLTEALESVRRQSMPDWECIIIDDGSTDDTKSVVQDFIKDDPRFIYSYQHNQGLAASRNNGMALARGKYFQFLDADDKICPEKLKVQAAYLEGHPQTDIVFGDHLFFETESPDEYFSSKSRRKGKTIGQQCSGPGSVVLDALLRNNIMVVSAPLIRRTVFDQGLRFDITYNTLEDWRFWIDCALRHYYFQYCKVPDTETLIRFGHSSMMSAQLKMNLGGQKIRRYLHPHLAFSQKLYNAYRMQKLLLKNMYLNLFRKK